LTRSLGSRLFDFGEFVIQPRVFAPLLVALAMMISAYVANRGLPTSDEGFVLALAGRILRGAVFYRDLDAYQFPGAMYLLAGWMWAFGESVNSARWLAAIVFSGMVLGLYLTAAQLLDRSRAAIFGVGVLSFKILAAPAFTAFMYSDLAFCLGVFAIALFVGQASSGRSFRLVAAGILVALATASKQNLGIYLAGMAIFVLAFSPMLLGLPDPGFRRRRSEVGAFVLGLFIATAPMLGYFASKGLLAKLFISGVLNPFLIYLPTSGISFLEPVAWWEFGGMQGNDGFAYFIGPLWTMLSNDLLPFESLYPAYWAAGEFFSRALYTALPLAFLALFWRWGRAVLSRRFGEREQRTFVFGALAFAVMLSAFPRADLFHVMSVFPVVFLLLFVLLQPADSDSSAGASSPRAPWLLAFSIGVLLAVSGSIAIVHHSSMTHRMQVARADLYVEPSKSWVEAVVNYVDGALWADDRLFVFGHEAHFYFLTGHYYSWPFVQLYPGQVGGDQGRPLVKALLADPPDLILRGILVWPGMPDVRDYAKAPTYYVATNYSNYEEFFDVHPPATGELPPEWAISILRPRY
jgi:hypothetical protein